MKTRSNIAEFVRSGPRAAAVLAVAAILLVTVNAHAADARVELGGVVAVPGSTVLLPVYYQEGDSGGISVLFLRLKIPLAQIELREVIPEASLAAAGKRLDYKMSGEELSLCVFGGRSKIVSGQLCSLLLQVLPEVSPPGVLILSTLEIQGADRDEKRVALSASNGAIGVVADMVPHKADRDGDWSISLAELLRMIQFYNVGEHHCDAGSGDGYAPGPGDTGCDAHDADYSPADWTISFTELLRMIQFYNSPHGVYHVLAGTEDGFAPGPFGMAYE